MPRQDAYERWVSDDGTSYWDGREWQPIAAITGYPMYTVQARRVAVAGEGWRGWRWLFRRGGARRAEAER